MACELLALLTVAAPCFVGRPPLLMTTSEKATQSSADSPFPKSSHLSRIERADERTRTADLISLRVIIHAL